MARPRSYTVLEHPARPAPEGVVVVAHGFCWPGAVLPVAWLAWRRLWGAGLAYLAALGVLMSAGPLLGLPFTVVALGVAGVHLLVGLEGGAWRREALRRRGWRVCAVVLARSLLAAERRFFAHGAQPPESA